MTGERGLLGLYNANRSECYSHLTISSGPGTFSFHAREAQLARGRALSHSAPIFEFQYPTLMLQNSLQKVGQRKKTGKKRLPVL